MLDKILKSKFYSKSKSAIKLTEARIATIKRKRNAMQKFLKKDIADLLRSGLDTNAYFRAEGLFNELNLSSCYDFVDKFCNQILSHLAAMDKQRECPDECREAASSLMYAAARFADLPELRDLRDVFLERYGDSVEHDANKEFINKLKSRPPTKDMKLQVLQDIAVQSGVEWNAKNLEQKLFNPPNSGKELTKSTDERSTSDMIDSVKDTKNKDAEYKHENTMKYSRGTREMQCLPNDGRNELSHNGSVLPTRKHSDGHNRPQLSCPRHEGSAPVEDQVDKLDMKEQNNEPLYVRSNSEEEPADVEPFYYKPVRLPSYKSKISSLSNRTDSEMSEHTGTNVIAGKEHDMHRHDPITEPKSKPKSVRTRNQKPRESLDCSEPKSSSTCGMNQDLGKQGRNYDKDAEEEMVERSLENYSHKMKLHAHSQKSKSVLESFPQQADFSRRVRDKESISIVKDSPPTRIASLPADIRAVEATKVNARLCSYKHDTLNSNGHLNSRPPDYDDFVARLAAFRENLRA